MTETKVLQLSFLNEAGKSCSIQITNPKEGLTLAAVKAVGDLIIEKALLEGGKSVLKSFKGAQLVTTKHEDLI